MSHRSFSGPLMCVRATVCVCVCVCVCVPQCVRRVSDSQELQRPPASTRCRPECCAVATKPRGLRTLTSLFALWLRCAPLRRITVVITLVETLYV